MPSGYHSQRLCAHVRKNNVQCKAIAVVGSEFCRSHSGLSAVQRLQRKQAMQALAPGDAQAQAYAPAATSVRAYYEQHLNAPGLMTLQNEVALLKARLQELLDAPINNLAVQLQVIARIESLINSVNRINNDTRSVQAAERKVSLVINKIALVINNVVTDRALRTAIARALAEAGVINNEAEAETLPETRNVEEQTRNAHVINNQVLREPVINTDEETAASRTRRVGEGDTFTQDIGSLPAPANFEIKIQDPGAPSIAVHTKNLEKDFTDAPSAIPPDAREFNTSA